MTLGVIAIVATILGVPLGVLGIIYVARQQARDQAKVREDAKQAVYNDGYKAGQSAAAPDLSLMRSQRDDARRERDNERADRIAAEQRVDLLEDELRGRNRP